MWSLHVLSEHRLDLRHLSENARLFVAVWGSMYMIMVFQATENVTFFENKGGTFRKCSYSVYRMEELQKCKKFLKRKHKNVDRLNTECATVSLCVVCV